jgi:FAD-dependent oxidoreductase domain-containing protein 1
VSFREQGYLVLASDSGKTILEENHRLQLAHGADNVLLGAEELAARFPWIATDGLAAGCFGLSGEGWLDPYSLMSILRKGTEVIAAEVTGIDLNASGIALSNGERIVADHIVNAAGYSAGAIAAMAGIALPVGPRKRYVYVIDCPTAPPLLAKAPLTVDPSGIYMRPEGKHFICGLSPEDHEEPADLSWDVDYAWFEDRIWPVLAARIPAFEAIKVINAWVGLYDYNALDQNGIIGRHPEHANFYFANGFSGHGLQQGPATGNAIAELIVHGHYGTIDLTRLGYERIAANAPLPERVVI